MKKHYIKPTVEFIMCEIFTIAASVEKYEVIVDDKEDWGIGNWENGQ